MTIDVGKPGKNQYTSEEVVKVIRGFFIKFKGLHINSNLGTITLDEMNSSFDTSKLQEDIKRHNIAYPKYQIDIAACTKKARIYGLGG